MVERNVRIAGKSSKPKQRFVGSVDVMSNGAVTKEIYHFPFGDGLDGLYESRKE